MSTAHAIRRYLPVVALALGFAGQAQAQNDKQEVKHLHVLLVMDTSDPALDKGVRKDQRNITVLLADHIPKDRYSMKVFSGPSITSDQIYNYIKNLKVGPGEGILFYYSGHGAIVEGKGHTLELQSGKQAVRRGELLKAMTDKKAALTVLLTDCCSNRISYADEKAAALVEGDPRGDLLLEPTPLIRKLFFQSRGLVDITAATNDVALADDLQGGYFTKALFRTVYERDKKKDAPLGWKDFFAVVSKDVGVIQKEAVSRGILPSSDKFKVQIPTAFSISVDTPPGGGNPPPNSGRVAAIIGLTNPATEEVEIQYRWDPSHDWRKTKIAANGRISIGTVIPPTMTKSPPLLVRLNGKDYSLESARFDLPRPPKIGDAPMHKLGDKK